MIRDFMIPDDETINAIISDFTIKPPKKPSWLNVIDDMDRARSSKTVSCSISMPKPDSSYCSSSINCSTRSFYDDDMLDYLLKDITEKKAEEAEELLKRKIESDKRKTIKDFINSIRKVQFTDPWTIIFWKNGEVTRIKCQDGDEYSKETGLALGIIKHMFGDTNYFNTIFKKLVPKEDN